jgi:hypothetical protein
MIRGRLRKAMTLVWAVAALGLLASAVWSEDQIVRVYVNGRQQAFQPPARMRAGTAYAPLRAAAKAVGAKVEWNTKGQMAIVCVGTQCAPIKASQGITVDGSLLIPLRVMAEALKCRVAWNSKANAVEIMTAGYKSPLQQLGACPEGSNGTPKQGST